MSDPKPTELTEAEQRALFTAFTEDSITALRDFIETVKADAWAAARREALLEARDYLSEQEQFDAAELVRALLAEPECDEESGR